MSDEKPPEKPTVKFEPPPKWAQDGFERVHAGIGALNSRLDEQDTKLDKCIHGLGTVTDEVNTLRKDHYEFKGAVEARFDSHSMRAKAESIHDEEQDKRLAELSESQMAKILAAAAKTPQGQKVANALVGLVLLLIAAATLYLSAKVGLK